MPELSDLIFRHFKGNNALRVQMWYHIHGSPLHYEGVVSVSE